MHCHPRQIGYSIVQNRASHIWIFLEVIGRRVEDFSEKFRMGQAENYLRNQRLDEELEAWIREIREDAFVEIRI